MALVKALLAANKEGAAAFTWTVPASQAPGDFFFQGDGGGGGFSLACLNACLLERLLTCSCGVMAMNANNTDWPFLRPYPITPSQATDLTGAAFGFSPTFTVDTKRRRRLFGPAHEFFD